MSTVIDTNVVQMKFDNSQFEKNCAESMNTLDKLKQKINDSGSGSALSGLSNSINNIDTSAMTSALESIQRRFSTLGIIGMTIISNLTSAAMSAIGNIASSIKSMIVTGGITRALNIEQARFQIEGLDKDWTKLSEDINYAVDGTAYGFDAAAKAAAQLSASGIEAGDSMKSALRGISGVAAMANSSYEDISPIFTTVAGQGKLMTMQLRQLESRGLNVAATLGEQMGYTEAQIRDMVTQGKISFEDFSNAMDNAFGEHAKDANKTFTGVISNIKAAFARIGADFITPIVEQESPIVLMLQRVREKVNEVKESLQPLVKLWTALVTLVGQQGQKIVKSFDINNIMVPFYNILHSIINLFKALYKIVKPIGDAIKEVFPPSSTNLAIRLTDVLVKLSEKFIITDKHAEQLKIAFKGVFDIVKLLFDGLKTGIEIIFGMSDGVGSLSDAFFNVIEAIGLFTSGVIEAVRESKTLSGIISKIKEFVVDLANGISTSLDAIAGKDSGKIGDFANNLAIKKGLYSSLIVLFSN